MNINEAIEDYLVEIEIRKYTPVTIKNQKSKLNQFGKYCIENNVTDAEELTLPVVKKYTQHLIQKGYRGLSINGMLKVIKVFIQYCYDEDYGGFNTNTKKIKWVKQEKPVVKSFTVADVKMMLNECKGNTYLDIRDKTILIMLFETGIRVSELRTITEKDIFCLL
jgi:integrase/recombinase XerD